MGPGLTNNYVDSRAEYEIKKKWKTVGYVVSEIDHVYTTISSGLIAVRLSRWILSVLGISHIWKFTLSIDKRQMDRKHLAPWKLSAFPPGFIRGRLLYMEKMAKNEETHPMYVYALHSSPYKCSKILLWCICTWDMSLMVTCKTVIIVNTLPPMWYKHATKWVFSTNTQIRI